MFDAQYAAVEDWHPYRSEMPWRVPGSRLIMRVDGVNGSNAGSNVIAERISLLKESLRRDLAEAGFETHSDNHDGFTVRIWAPEGEPTQRVQYRFSDSSMSIWIMPEGWLPPRLR